MDVIRLATPNPREGSAQEFDTDRITGVTVPVPYDDSVPLLEVLGFATARPPHFQVDLEWSDYVRGDLDAAVGMYVVVGDINGDIFTYTTPVTAVMKESDHV